VNKPTLSKVVCILFVFCAVTAIGLPAQVLTTLHSFAGPPNDGATPQAGLLRASDGNFYGTTEDGGASGNCNGGCGTVFKITSNGTLTILYSFNSSDGAQPLAGLVQASDGNFYGTTSEGGVSGYGVVFKITSSGVLTTLYSFCSQSNCTDGANPYAGLIQASDGNLYGTTYEGGASNCGYGYGCGTVFKITPSGTLTTLYSFCGQANCADGMSPRAGLMQASDGNFYGTTSEGEENGYGTYGTVFEITPNGSLTTLYRFCSELYCDDGANRFAGLIQATDGSFYGTTSRGGADSTGTVFQFAGGLYTLHIFEGRDGEDPVAGLVQARDGNFYGTTSVGGANGAGTVFKITPNGTLTTLHRFSGSDGARPDAALVQASDGNFYGTTSGGGADGYGTVFRLVLLRPCVVCPSVE
jgi:uncharacterized repeat protein (TIGR03803 family)